LSDHLKILFSGMVAGHPHQGGATWAVLQYVLGLERLGHEVVLVEPVAREAWQPAGAPLADTANARYFEHTVARFGLEGRSALLAAGSRETVGLPYRSLHEAAAQADCLINVSGMLADEALLSPIATRVYLDLDPAFIQLWHAVSGVDMRFDAHTHFVTIGQSIGLPECPVPTCGRRWIPTLQPIVLAHWPEVTSTPRYPLTTVGNWRGYGSIEHEGVHYGQKAHSLRTFFDLPSQTEEPFALAVSIHPDETTDLQALNANGWQLLDPAALAGSPDAYQTFVQSSKAEFGIAKSGYVNSRCGWFSDRSLCYLASGRPVIAQDTGFDAFVPTGEGLFAFATHDDVLLAIDAVNGDYSRHASAARSLAVEHFDSDRVLARLLDCVGGSR